MVGVFAMGFGVWQARAQVGCDPTFSCACAATMGASLCWDVRPNAEGSEWSGLSACEGWRRCVAVQVSLRKAAPSLATQQEEAPQWALSSGVLSMLLLVWLACLWDSCLHGMRCLVVEQLLRALCCCNAWMLWWYQGGTTEVSSGNRKGVCKSSAAFAGPSMLQSARPCRVCEGLEVRQ